MQRQWICGKLGKAFTELVFPWIKVGILIGSDSIMMQMFFIMRPYVVGYFYLNLLKSCHFDVYLLYLLSN